MVFVLYILMIGMFTESVFAYKQDDVRKVQEGILSGCKDFEALDLSYASLDFFDLTGAYFLKTNLYGASVHGAVLDNVTFDQSDISFIDFYKAASCSHVTTKRVAYNYLVNILRYCQSKEEPLILDGFANEIKDFFFIRASYHATSLFEGPLAIKMPCIKPQEKLSKDFSLLSFDVDCIDHGYCLLCKTNDFSCVQLVQFACGHRHFCDCSYRAYYLETSCYDCSKNALVHFSIPYYTLTNSYRPDLYKDYRLINLAKEVVYLNKSALFFDDQNSAHVDQLLQKRLLLGAGIFLLYSYFTS